jgi:uncharacterized damage-inducible protein DinB
MIYGCLLVTFRPQTLQYGGVNPLVRLAILVRNMEDNTATMFLRFSRNKLMQQYWPRLRQCVASLGDEQIWWRPNEASNSVGNLLLHLAGNVQQWLVVPFQNLEDLRDRTAEFSQQEGETSAQLLTRLATVMDEAGQVLERLTEADLTARFRIQGYTIHGLDAVYQVVEHFGLHYGQIVYITKMLEGQDLGFYRQLSQTGHAPAGASDDEV